MLCVRLPFQHKSSVNYTNMEHLSNTPIQMCYGGIWIRVIAQCIYDKLCNFSQTRPPRRVDTSPRYANVGIKFVSQEYNDQLPSSGNEPRVDNLAVANLLSYPMRCTAAVVGVIALGV